MKPSFEKINYKNQTDSSTATAFQVETDPAIMKRLSDDVYHDPISAIIRELSTNAYDAHIDSGNIGRPFDINLPTDLDLIFKIRDYGTGLDKQSLTDMYTRYGKSSRRESNNHIGSIGIGSKSPFSYAAQFSVCSYYNGQKFSALCYKDEYHMPYIQIIAEEPTSEENGLEISFPIKKEDVKIFENKAAKVLQWFKTRPNINIKLDFSKEISENKWLEKPGSWFIYNDARFPNRFENKIQVLMGNVLYNTGHAQDKFKNCVLEAQIGDVDINLSRESIQDNAKNTSWILQALKKVQEESKKEIIKLVDETPENYKKIIAVNKYKVFTKNTEKVNGSSGPVPDAINFPVIQQKNKAGESYETGKCTLSIISLHRQRTGPLYRNINAEYFENTQVMYADIKTGFIKAAKEYIEQNSQYLKETQANKRWEHRESVLLIEGGLDVFCQVTGYPKKDIIYASKYYSKSTTNSRARINSNIFIYDPLRKGISDSTYSARYWNVLNNFDIKKQTKTLIYVPIYHYNMDFSNHSDYNKYSLNLNNVKNDIDFNKCLLIGVKKKSIKWAIQNKITHINDYLSSLQLSQQESDKLYKAWFSEEIDSSPRVDDFMSLIKLIDHKFINLLISNQSHKTYSANYMADFSKTRSYIMNFSKFDKNNQIEIAARKEAQSIITEIDKNIKNSKFLQVMLKPNLITKYQSQIAACL